MVSEPNRETQGVPLAFWRYMEVSLPIPDILSQYHAASIPCRLNTMPPQYTAASIPCRLNTMPLGDPRHPGPEQWDFDITKSNSSLRSANHSILGAFGSRFGRVWIHCGSDSGPVFVPFRARLGFRLRTVLDPFWIRFEPHLGPFKDQLWPVSGPFWGAFWVRFGLVLVASRAREARPRKDHKVM